MCRKALRSWLVGTACWLLAGCGGVSVSLSFFDHDHVERAQVLPFQEVIPVIPSAIATRRLVVIRDLTAWDTLWREHASAQTPASPLPGVNFSQNMVIGIFLGARPGPCRKIDIHSISQHFHPQRIEVAYREISVSVDGACPPGGNNPARLVVLPYSAFPIEFIQTS